MSALPTPPKRIVIESPLAGDFQENFRYLLWCCRAVWLRDGSHPIASHLLNPWFMDDTLPSEREAGIANPWVWSREVPHVFFTDRGESSGMKRASLRCFQSGIEYERLQLAEVNVDCWDAYQRGEWPPHTPGFEVAR